MPSRRPPRLSVRRSTDGRPRHLSVVHGPATADPDVPAPGSPPRDGAGSPVGTGIDGIDPDPLDPQGLIAAIGDSLTQAVARSRSVLESEIALSSMLGTVETEVLDADPQVAVADMVQVLAGYLESVGSADALACLRLLSSFEPSPSTAAAAAADRLAAGGVRDRPWAGRVGRPEAHRAWRYGDVLGVQESIGVLFSDGGRDHAVMVLIDNGLGGGVKDVLVAEGRDARSLRDQTARSIAGDEATVFEDVDFTVAATALLDALDCPACPVEADQIDDVGRYLPLVRSRARRLAEIAGVPIDDGDDEIGSSASAVPDVLRVKVSLQGMRPPVWRRLEVPATITLAALQDVIAVAFGWSGSHLSWFEEVVPGRRSGAQMHGPMLRRVPLEHLAGFPGDRLRYVYDPGDDWRHLIEVEERRPADADGPLLRCTGGRRAAPIEDCGGILGYEELLAAMDDPSHPLHADLPDLVPVGFDPARFDRAGVDARLARLT